MRRVAAACLLLTAGCSTAPVADVMDYFAPGRLAPAPGYYGGVGSQPAAPPAVVAPPPPEAAPPVLPPPAPPPG